MDKIPPFKTVSALRKDSAWGGRSTNTEPGSVARSAQTSQPPQAHSVFGSFALPPHCNRSFTANPELLTALNTASAGADWERKRAANANAQRRRTETKEEDNVVEMEEFDAHHVAGTQVFDGQNEVNPVRDAHVWTRESGEVREVHSGDDEDNEDERSHLISLEPNSQSRSIGNSFDMDRFNRSDVSREAAGAQGDDDATLRRISTKAFNDQPPQPKRSVLFKLDSGNSKHSNSKAPKRNCPYASSDTHTSCGEDDNGKTRSPMLPANGTTVYTGSKASDTKAASNQIKVTRPEFKKSWKRSSLLRRSFFGEKTVKDDLDSETADLARTQSKQRKLFGFRIGSQLHRLRPGKLGSSVVSGIANDSDVHLFSEDDEDAEERQIAEDINKKARTIARRAPHLWLFAQEESNTPKFTSFPTHCDFFTYLQQQNIRMPHRKARGRQGFADMPLSPDSSRPSACEKRCSTRKSAARVDVADEGCEPCEDAITGNTSNTRPLQYSMHKDPLADSSLFNVPETHQTHKQHTHAHNEESKSELAKHGHHDRSHERRRHKKRRYNPDLSAYSGFGSTSSRSLECTQREIRHMSSVSPSLVRQLTKKKKKNEYPSASSLALKEDAVTAGEGTTTTLISRGSSTSTTTTSTSTSSSSSSSNMGSSTARRRRRGRKPKRVCANWLDVQASTPDEIEELLSIFPLDETTILNIAYPSQSDRIAFEEQNGYAIATILCTVDPLDVSETPESALVQKTPFRPFKPKKTTSIKITIRSKSKLKKGKQGVPLVHKASELIRRNYTKDGKRSTGLTNPESIPVTCVVFKDWIITFHERPFAELENLIRDVKLHCGIVGGDYSHRSMTWELEAILPGSPGPSLYGPTPHIPAMPGYSDPSAEYLSALKRRYARRHHMTPYVTVDGAGAFVNPMLNNSIARPGNPELTGTPPQEPAADPIQRSVSPDSRSAGPLFTDENINNTFPRHAASQQYFQSSITLGSANLSLKTGPLADMDTNHTMSAASVAAGAPQSHTTAAIPDPNAGMKSPLQSGPGARYHHHHHSHPLLHRMRPSWLLIALAHHAAVSFFPDAIPLLQAVDEVDDAVFTLTTLQHIMDKKAIIIYTTKLRRVAGYLWTTLNKKQQVFEFLLHPSTRESFLSSKESDTELCKHALLHLHHVNMRLEYARDILAATMTNFNAALSLEVAQNSYRLNRDAVMYTLVTTFGTPMLVITGLFGMNCWVPYQEEHGYTTLAAFFVLISVTILWFIVLLYPMVKLYIQKLREQRRADYSQLETTAN